MSVLPEFTEVQAETLKYHIPQSKILSDNCRTTDEKLHTDIAASMKGGKIGSILALPTDIATIPANSVALALERRSSSFVSTINIFINSRTLSAYGRKACSAADATEPIADYNTSKQNVKTLSWNIRLPM